jgi:hypothetical protein
VIDCEFESRSGQSKNYEIGICYFSAKNTILRSKRKGWLALNQNNMWTVSYYYANSTTRVSLVQCGHYNHFTECIFLAMLYIEDCSSSVNQQPINHWTRKQLGWPFRRCLLCWNIYIYIYIIMCIVNCSLQLWCCFCLLNV